MKKKILALLLALAAALSLVGCSQTAEQPAPAPEGAQEDAPQPSEQEAPETAPLTPGTYTATKEGFQHCTVTVSVTVDETSIQNVGDRRMYRQPHHRNRGSLRRDPCRHRRPAEL